MNSNSKNKDHIALISKLQHLQLDPKPLLVDDDSERHGELKKDLHPFLRELISSR
jgi:hypothetical protein